MTRQGKYLYIKLTVLFIAVVSAMIFVYTLKLREVLERNILLSVQETALHDKRAIRTCLEFFLSELSGIAKRLVLYNCQSIGELETRLNLDLASSSFSRFFLLADDGRVFTDRFIVYQPGKWPGGLDFANIFSGKADELVLRFDDNREFAGISREYILYGKQLDNFSVQGVRMLAIFGVTDINFLQEHMLLDSFVIDGVPRGFSSVIDFNGNFIVGRTKDIYLRNDSNFFSQLAAAEDSSLGKREIVSRMRRNESFSFYMETPEGRELIYLLPFADGEPDGPQPDWYFVMTVNNDVLQARQATFSIMTLSLLGIVVVLLTFLLLYGMITRSRLSMANQAANVRSGLFASLGSELQLPLNILLRLINLAASHLADPERLAQVRGWLSRSRSLLTYLQSLLDETRALSEGAAPPALANEAYSIDDMLEKLETMKKSRLAGAGVILEVSGDIRHDMVIGDGDFLLRLLSRIIDNAAVFTAGGGSIKLHASQEETSGGQVVTTYECVDSGLGEHFEDMAPLRAVRHEDVCQEDDGSATPCVFTVGQDMALALGARLCVRRAGDGRGECTLAVPTQIARGDHDGGSGPQTAPVAEE